MLSQADAVLVERDPAIVGLATLFDPAAFATLLRERLPDAAIGDVEARYVRYKPGTSCLIAYRVISHGAPVMIYACAYAAKRRGKLDNARWLTEEKGFLGPAGLLFDEQAIAVYIWPYDPALPAMARLEHQAERQDIVQKMCPSLTDRSAPDLITLRYRPERRYVGQLRGTGGDGVLKLYAAREYARAQAAALTFRSSGALRVVQPLGHCDHHRMLLFPWFPGTPLNDMIWKTTWQPAALSATGAALATLHRQAAPHMPLEDHSTWASVLTAANRAVAPLCPALAVRAEQLATTISTELRRGTSPTASLHGDFYADQVLIDADQAMLLDLDNAAQGDPAADLGNFSAHLWRAVMVGNGTRQRAIALEEVLWAGYASTGDLPDPRRIALYRAAGLLRLAVEPFRYRAANWPEQIATLVTFAERIAADNMKGRNGYVQPSACTPDQP